MKFTQLFRLLACTFFLAVASAQAAHDLQLTLAEGFLGEEVIVRSDGQIVLQKVVSTTASSGIATYLTVNAKTSQPVIQVEVPRLKVKSQYAVDLNKADYLEISLNHGRLVWRPTIALITRPAN